MISSERSLFYQSHLDRVSRSFAFCIARLQPPFREHVGLSYLLFRVLDTVEDAVWASSSEQETAFQIFQDFIEERPERREIRAWTLMIPTSIPEGERTLLNDSAELFEDFHNLPVPIRDALARGLQNMARGMRHFSSKTGSHKIQLVDLDDVDRYCFFVAGIVGELLSEIYFLQRKMKSPSDEAISTQNELSPELLVRSIHFGLFLQKVNLLKDQQGDQVEGKSLVPDRTRLLQSLRLHGEQALQYILALPEEDLSYRTFCSWSLFLGMASLPWIERSYRKNKSIKIPRWRAKLLLRKVEKLANDNTRLRRFYNQLAERNLPPGMEPAVHSVVKPFPEIFRLYQGRMGVRSLTELRLINGSEQTLEGLCHPQTTQSL